VVKQALAGECHHHAVFVGRLDDVLVPARPARLDDIADPGPRSPVDVVPSYEGKPILVAKDIHDAKAEVEKGRETVKMTIRRGEEEIELTLEPRSIGIWTEERPR
jgi:hypothetical protein